jgi:type VII secretion protein EccB
MATKKDLVEAYSFSRRRLVTAFVSGAPGGREVEPARPGRSVVGGIALAVLLLAGAAIAGVFSKMNNVDWEEEALVVDSESGALYVNLGEVPGFDEPRLRPVVNVTSARLILGADVEAEEVSAEEIADRPKGPPIGIVDAPATVPPTADLLNTGWTACTATGHGVRTVVDEEEQARPVPEAGFVVRNGRTNYLIARGVESTDSPARAYRYEFPKGRDENIYAALQVAVPAEAVEVPDEWLALFPEGGELGAGGLGIEAAGAPPAAGLAAELPPDARVGDYFEQGGVTYVVGPERLARFDPFAAAVLEHAELGGYRPKPLTVEMDAAFRYDDPPYAGAQWPAALPTSRNSQGDELCAVLQPQEGERPVATLALDPTEDASLADTDRGDLDVAVQSGHGAVVRSGDWLTDASGTTYLLDDRGITHRLRDEADRANLGYDDVDPVVVPDAWLSLFVIGVELSQDAALCPPASPNSSPCS